jgi:hypothetical protein
VPIYLRGIRMECQDEGDESNIIGGGLWPLTWGLPSTRRVFHAKLNDARDITTAIKHPLDADPGFIRQIVNQKTRFADHPKPQGSVPGSPPRMRTRQRMSDEELCGFLRHLEESVSRLWALSNGDAGENAIEVTLRPGTDPGIHLPFPHMPGQFSPPLANPLPNRIGEREMFALYSIVDQGVKIVGVRRFVGPQNEQFAAAGNDRRMALKGGVGQPAKGALRFAETASLQI